MRTTSLKVVAAAAALTLLSPAAMAQATGDTVDTSYGNPQPQEDDGFPWGLLGLLGLLGLIPRKRNDAVHIDNRNAR